jgi:lysophospholipase L1-like esterase
MGAMWPAQSQKELTCPGRLKAPEAPDFRTLRSFRAMIWYRAVILLKLILACFGIDFDVSLAASSKPRALILLGDSTTAVSTGTECVFRIGLTSGYGSCIGTSGLFDRVVNLGVKGYTTRMYIRDGYLAKAVKTAHLYSKAGFTVTCAQDFGHNDEKSWLHRLFLPRYFFIQYSIVVHRALATACDETLMTTPVARRFYNHPKTTRLNDELKTYASYVRRAAELTRATVLDLHKKSVALLQTMSEGEASQYDYAKGDKTHLNAAGCKKFASLWADEYRKLHQRALK